MTDDPRGWPMLTTPAVMVEPDVAAAISATLVRALEQAQRAGERVPPRVVATIRAIESLGRAHRQSTAVIEPPCSATGTSERSDLNGHATLGTSMVAALLECTPRNVVALARRGSLPGVQASGRWFFDPVEVDGFINRRKAEQ